PISTFAAGNEAAIGADHEIIEAPPRSTSGTHIGILAGPDSREARNRMRIIIEVSKSSLLNFGQQSIFLKRLRAALTDRRPLRIDRALICVGTTSGSNAIIKLTAARSAKIAVAIHSRDLFRQRFIRAIALVGTLYFIGCQRVPGVPEQV